MKVILQIIAANTIILFLLCIGGCTENKIVNSDNEVIVRIEAAPKTLSPILATTIHATQVNEYIYVSLGDYDPISLELIPVLIRDIPTAEKITEGAYAGSEAYTFQMKAGATWSNGSQITGKDVLFTYKMAFHPDVISPGWKALLEDIDDVIVDKEDATKFTILTSGGYFLNLEGILSAEIYPQYLYKGSEVIDAISLTALKSVSSEELASQFPGISQLGKEFLSVKFGKEIIEGAGPYELTEWKGEEYLVLSKKKDYWGDKYSNNNFLKGNFDKIIFQIVPDETVALTLLKNDELDVLDLTKYPIIVFNELKGITEDDIATHSSKNSRNNMLLINNQDEILNDKRVREALVAATDVDRMIKQLEGGAGIRTNSIISPYKPAYKKDLAMPLYDLDKARTLLEKAGWKDTDGDDIRDKIIDGRKEQLSLDFMITTTSASAGISSILIQSAKEVGIEINPIIKEKFSVIVNDHLKTGDYDLSVFANIASTSSYDPYTSWHSASIGVEGRNYAGYSNPEADKAIENIRKLDITNDERKEAYYELQDIMLKDYPVIFLYSPLGRYAIDEDMEPVISLKRPGVFVNAFMNKE